MNWKMLRLTIFRAPDDGTGGGGSGDDGEDKSGGGSLLDHADKGEGAGEGGENGDDDAARDGDGAAKPSLLTERPAYLPERLWPKDVGEGVDPLALLEKLAGSYGELDAKFKRGDHKVPEKADGYKLEFSDDLAETAKAFGLSGEKVAETPGVKEFLEFAHARKWSNEDVNAALGWALKFSADTVGVPIDPAVAAKAEIDKLGKGGQALINGLDAWAHALKNQEILSDEEFGALRTMARSADEVRVLAKLRELSGEQPIPLDTAVEDGLPSAEEAYAMTADPKYGTDPAFTSKVDRIFVKVFGEEPAGTSRANMGMRG